MFPMVDGDVEGTQGRTKVRALLDTGFSDYLCLPTEIGVRLGLKLAGRNPVEYADGTQKQELYFKGRARFKGKTKTVEIYLTDSDEALVGMKMLHGCRVLLDVAEKKARITRTKNKKSKTKGE
jgi:clan AA aspartic protease